MLANTLLILGASVAIAVLLDMFLSDRQKAAIARGTLRLWDLLDDARRLSVLNWLRSKKEEDVNVFKSIAGYLAFSFTGQAAMRSGLVVMSLVPAILVGVVTYWATPP